MEMTIKRRCDQGGADTPRKISHARTLFEDVNFQFPPDNTPRADETHFLLPEHEKTDFYGTFRGCAGKIVNLCFVPENRGRITHRNLLEARKSF